MHLKYLYGCDEIKIKKNNQDNNYRLLFICDFRVLISCKLHWPRNMEK